VQTLRDYPAALRQTADVTTGTVWTEALAQTGSPAVLVNRAHFSPGARTCWHRHQRGQTLIIESGVALVQEEGGPILELRPQQILECAPGVNHWHGASGDHAMTQFAITTADGQYATWGQLVTDEQYYAGRR